MITRRLFFAFWPDEPLRQSITTARAQLFPLAGRPVAPSDLHVTAAFLGSVDEARLGALLALSGAIAPLAIRFDRLEHWGKPRVLVAASTHVQDDVRRVVDALWQRLDRLGFARDPRPFRPHVTLVRDVRSVHTRLRWSPLAWPADHLQLVESVTTPTGSHYSLVETAIRSDQVPPKPL